MRAWVGLLLFAVAFVAGAFGVAVLAAEWRQDDIDRLSGDVTELRTEVDDFRAGIRDLTDALEPPTPTATAEPATLAAKAGGHAELRGMRLTIETSALQRHGGSMQFVLENIDAPEDQARPDVFNWKAVNYQDVVCSTSLTGTVARLAPGQKLTFGVTWLCPGSPPRSLHVDHVVIALPTVEAPAGE